MQAWRQSLCDDLTGSDFPRCVLACDALALKPDVSVGLYTGDLELSNELLHSLTASSTEFMDFVRGNWKRVFQAALAFEVHPLNPDLPSVL
jgi:hypothetical protein